MAGQLSFKEFEDSFKNSPESEGASPEVPDDRESGK